MDSDARKQSADDWHDEDPIDDDENPEWTEEDFARARPIDQIPELADLAEFIRKGGRLALPARYREPVTVPLDKDIIEHFKVGEEGWMDRINAALRKAAGFDPS